MRAFVSSYFIAASFMFIRHGYESVFSPRRSSRHKQGTALQTSHPAGRRPHHGPAFGTGELQESGNHSVRRRLTRQAGQRRRGVGAWIPPKRSDFNNLRNSEGSEKPRVFSGLAYPCTNAAERGIRSSGMGG